MIADQWNTNTSPLDLKAYKLVLLNTNVKHKLSESAYNRRREQCEVGVALIKAKYPEVNSLRDVTLNQLEELVKPVDEDVYNKCVYVVEEINRTQVVAEKLKKGDLNGLGKLMFETHTGLSKVYEVSCKELDFLVDNVTELDEVLGARMMGGGFGGCTINLIQEDQVDEFVAKLKLLYNKEFGISLDAYIVEIGDGSTLLTYL